jgi:hypothetical protein
MNKVLSVVLICLLNLPGSAQSPKEKKGFNTNRLFIGSALNIGYGGGNGGSSFIAGINPEIGYTIAKFLDGGLAFNMAFSSYKYDNFGTRITENGFQYGGGAFVRIHPFNGFFLQIQPEYNWIDYTVKYTGVKSKFNTEAFSLLAGIGYGQRIIGQSGFFTTIMIDLRNDEQSPYRDGYNNIIPIIRTGFNVYLGQKRKK